MVQLAFELMDNIKVVKPRNLGWLEKKLSDEEMSFLFSCIENKKRNMNDDLAGNIYQSNVLSDTNNIFFRNTLLPLCKKYEEEFFDLSESVPINTKPKFFLKSFWVNFQKQNDFNPIHQHTGVYSFVIWMKIPTRHKEQNANIVSNAPRVSSFGFIWTNILGQLEDYVYEMNPEVEGTMVFFPSKLKHVVYPFFNCDETRISISGNIALNTGNIREVV